MQLGGGAPSGVGHKEVISNQLAADSQLRGDGDVPVPVVLQKPSETMIFEKPWMCGWSVANAGSYKSSGTKLWKKSTTQIPSLKLTFANFCLSGSRSRA